MDVTVIISDKVPKRQITLSVCQLAITTGYHKSHISRVLSGKNKPSMECLDRMATAMGITTDDLIKALKGIKVRREKGRGPLRMIYAEPKIG